MRSIVLVLAGVVVPLPVMAASFEQSDGGYVWREGDQYVRFDGGRWRAGIDGKGEFAWHMFLWHDHWVYETLPGGKVVSGPSLADDGSLTMRGTFSAREDSPAVEYTYRISPSDHGLRIRCTLRKTAPLKLTRGVWLHVFGDRDQLKESNRVWLAPSTFGKLAAAPGGPANRVMLEIDQGRSLCLGLPGYRTADREGSDRGHAFRVNLLPDDFDVDRPAAVEYAVSFADMPERFPGQIDPVAKPLAIHSVAASADRVAQYGKFELKVELGATYDNPFDPDDVRLDGVFITPSGRRLVVPGFFTVPHCREVVDEAEVMIPQSDAGWRVRFAPREPGGYRYQLRLRDRTGELTGGEGALECVAGEGRGFIGTSKADPHYLAFDNGAGYFAIGHNLPIYHTTGQLGDEAMRRFAAAGENVNRWWMSSSGFGIEWGNELGWYRQDVAARIDLVLDLAAQQGLYYMMCMDTHQDFREKGWHRNPFNAQNGGPCQTPRDWFTSEAARKYYRKRLRYTVARWGYSPNVLCWEFGNEMEGWADSPDEVKLPWHREMSDYLRRIDPFDHLITTSFWSKTGPEAYWELPNIDLVQTHCYTNNDNNVAPAVRDYCLHQWERFDKPHIFGEFGIRSHSTTADKDPEGWAIHNGLWAGLMSFAAGGPMPWWHERYIDRLDLYFHFTSLSRFAADLPLGTARWSKLETAVPEYLEADRPPDLRDAVVATGGSWGKAEHHEFRVLRDGSVEGDRQPSELLHGQGHRDLKNPPTFIVDYPKPGTFTVRVGRVSASGRLKIWIDDKLELQHELPCGEGLGKQSVYRPQWKLWETEYDEDIAVDVPAGRHRIRVENAGRDWVRVSSYRFGGCRVLDQPSVAAYGMRSDGVAVLWLQNRDSSWYNHARDNVAPVDPFRLVVLGLPDRQYELQWWETWKGKPMRTERTESRDGRLPLVVPALDTDVAVKIRAK